MRKKLQLTLVASSLLSGTALAAVAAHQLAAHVAENQIAAAIARLPGAQFAAIHADALTGRVEVDGLSLKNGDKKLTVGKLDFRAFRPLPSFIAPAYAAGADASASNIVIDAGALKFTIDSIDAAGTTLTSAELADIVSPTSTTPLTERLAKLTAASISIPQITEDFVAAPNAGAVKIVYKNIKLTDVTGGKIASAAISGATIDSTGIANEKLSGVYGPMTAKNLDMALAARIFSTTSTDANEPLQPIYDSITLDSMAFTEVNDKSTAKITIGKMTAHDIKARPLSMAPADIGQFFTGLSGADQPSPAQTKTLIGLVANIVSSFEIGGVDVNDIHVDVTGPQAASVALSHIGIGDWSRGRVDSISYDGFVVNSGADVKATIGNFSLKGLNFGQTLAGLQTFAAQDDPDFDDLDPRSLLPSLDQISFSGLDFDVPDGHGRGNAVNGSRDQFKLGKFQIDLRHYFNGVPTAISTVIEGLTLAIPKSGEFKPLAALGYSTLTYGGKLDLEWKGPAEELSLNELSASIPGMGTVRLKGTLGNVTQDVFSNEMAKMEAAATAILLKGVDLYVQDDGLFNKGLAFQAQTSGSTPAQVRSQMTKAAGVGIPAALGDNATAKAIGAAVAKFIAQPKNLHITAKSADGIGAADMALLGNPADLLGKLDVTATANQ